MSTSWRESASPRAQQDLDGLLDAGLRLAQQQLGRRGEFLPFALTVTTGGQDRLVAGDPDPADEHPPSADVLALLRAGLVRQRDELRAAGVVADVRRPDGGDAVRVELEHSEGIALTVLLPYRQRWIGRRLSYGELVASPGVRSTWPAG